uniref:Uncharacterized protein n=1 Tax=Oryza meridionalis TaxID=40149 RepID=A0A0E0D280_9ORYZ
MPPEFCQCAPVVARRSRGEGDQHSSSASYPHLTLQLYTHRGYWKLAASATLAPHIIPIPIYLEVA